MNRGHSIPAGGGVKRFFLHFCLRGAEERSGGGTLSLSRGEGSKVLRGAVSCSNCGLGPEEAVLVGGLPPFQTPGPFREWQGAGLAGDGR
jgi:hypothetical protein